MAAVQPNQGIPQQGTSGNAMGQQTQLPPGMTREHVHQLFEVRPTASLGALRIA